MKYPLCSLFLLFCTASCKSQPLLTKDELKQALRTEQELDLQGGLLPAKVKARMARFFTDSASASSSLSSGNLLDLGLDSEAIMTVSVQGVPKSFGSDRSRKSKFSKSKKDETFLTILQPTFLSF